MSDRRDRRDRDELTDRDDLTAKCLAVLMESHEGRGDWNGDPYEQHPYEEAYKDWFWEDGAKALAVAILAAGWVHWPHDCDTEAELIAQWACASFDTMQELHRLRAEVDQYRNRAFAAEKAIELFGGDK